MKRSFQYTLLLSSALALAVTPASFAQDETTSSEQDDRTLETVVVRGQFIPEPQRETSQVASFLSNEDLARQGDDNAALALTRLSGLSVVGGRFAYVRGLGDRYSAALLNGSVLPSPEPLRRTVPLDLFPSNVLEGAAVQKTFSANYPGEFGGGLINLQTLKQPTETFLNVKIGAGINTETTMQDGLYVRGSDTDWTGFDDGLRDVPDIINQIVGSRTSLQDLEDIDPTLLEIAGESFVTTPLNVIQQGELGPNYEASIEGGTTIEYGEFDIGLVGVAGYAQDWDTEEAVRQFQNGGTLGQDFRSTETSLDITTNALGTATVGWGEHQVGATVFYVHDTTKQSQIAQGFDFNVGTSEGDQVLDEDNGWFERELAFYQLSGEHFFDNLEVNWRGSYSESGRSAPYELSLRRFFNGGEEPLYDVARQYRIRFSELEDEVYGIGGEVAYTFELPEFREIRVSAGGDQSESERQYTFLEFTYNGNARGEDFANARPDFLFSPDNINPQRFELSEIVNPNASYAAELDLISYFAQVEADITSFIQVTAGARYEDAEQRVITFDRFGNLGSGDVELLNDYILPGVTFTWNFADDLQLRLGYSETIARPQFRELAESVFVDPETDRSYRGNSELIDSELTNYDARIEYYMGRNQFVTAAAFFKEIENPIEEYQFEVSSFIFDTTFINSPKAELYGLELEYRNRFELDYDHPFFEGRDFLFSTNYTYTSSELIVGEDDVILNPVTGSFVPATAFGIDGAELQGTPENILNMQLGWETDNDQLTLLLGWVDERILQRGTISAPDIVEDPGIQLDLVYRRDITVGDRAFTLGLSGRNLLNEDNEEFQDGSTVGDGTGGITQFNTYDRGISVSASITAKF